MARRDEIRRECQETVDYYEQHPDEACDECDGFGAHTSDCFWVVVIYELKIKSQVSAGHRGGRPRHHRARCTRGDVVHRHDVAFVSLS